MSNIFEQALIEKVRFQSTRGEVTLEQLYDLPLRSTSGFDLDTVAKTVNAELKSTCEDSFVGATTTASAKLELKLDLVKAVIAHKQAVEAAKVDRNARKAEREVLINLLADKKSEALKGLTAEQIEQRLAALG